MKDQIKVRRPTDILPLVHKWSKHREENFLSISLNGAYNVIKIHHITKGLLNKTLAHPRECYFPVIRDYAAAVVFVHNHPSGNIKPSHEDDTITKKLCMAGVILDIQVIDHIIITPQNNFFSYRQEGKINDNFAGYELDSFIEGLTAEKEYEYAKLYKRKGGN